jgi:hypothetical protein
MFPQQLLVFISGIDVENGAAERLKNTGHGDQAAGDR